MFAVATRRKNRSSPRLFHGITLFSAARPQAFYKMHVDCGERSTASTPCRDAAEDAGRIPYALRLPVGAPFADGEREPVGLLTSLVPPEMFPPELRPMNPLRSASSTRAL